jgi:hypothetical protein
MQKEQRTAGSVIRVARFQPRPVPELGGVRRRVPSPERTRQALIGTRVLVIAARRRCGVFSMFFQVLGLLRWAEQAGYVPIVYLNRETCYWNEAGVNGARNAWEYFFLPVSKLEMKHLVADPSVLEGLDSGALWHALGGRAMVLTDYLGEGVGFGGQLDARQRGIAADLVERHVHIRPEIVSRIDAHFRRDLQGHFVVGVHYRGTDKAMEFDPVPFDRYRRELDRHIAASPELRILAATDCARFLAALQAVYGARVVSTASQRSQDANPVHLTSPTSAEEVLVDAGLLARSHHLIHGTSNVSAAVLVFNRRLAHTDLSRGPNAP